ncbi:MAG: inositol monophosphatase [Gemmatimonadetes bacterium]|nr:MAG: inositol monophosphatase [Gemmatimonadota bacterium]
MLEAAINAAKAGGAVLQTQREKLQYTEIIHKQARDFVTEIDIAAEKAILSLLADRFPTFGVLAEESEQSTTDSPYCWIIDPLDGTTNYIHGYQMYCVSIALQYEQELILGVVYDPVRDELFTAEKGKGAFLNGKPIQVTQTAERQMSLIATGFPFRKPQIFDHYLKVFRALFNICSDMRRAGSAALDLVHVACGRLDGFWEFNLYPWDIAAGTLIVKEAGGIVTEMSGSPHFLHTGNIVAANPQLHQQMLDCIQHVE